MSLVGELFAKDYAKERNLDWQRVMQVLASYNWENRTYDVRLELSGLKGLEEDIIYNFLTFMATEINHLTRKNYYDFEKKIFSFLGSPKEIVKRIEIEEKKKEKILPTLVNNAKEFAVKLGKELYMLEPMIFLRGSASPKSRKIFWYYEKNQERIFVSDIDIEVVICDFNNDVFNYARKEAYEFSLKNKIPINIHFMTFSNMDKGLFDYAYPLFIPYKTKN